MASTEFKRHLNLPETVAMSVALMAPTTAMVFVTPFLAQRAGYNVPLAFVVSLLSVMIIGYCFGRLGRRYAHAGSAYGLTKDTLGPGMGALAGWGLVFMYTLLIGALLAGTGAFAQLAIQQLLGVTVPWGLLSLLGGAVVVMFAVHNIRPSMRMLLAAELISMAMIVIVCVLILGHTHLTPAAAAKPFILNRHGIGGIAQALVFGLTAFLGFEGSATLGEESKDPKRMVPLAITLSALVGGLFFVFVAYSQTVGYGLSERGVAAFSSAGTPMNYLAEHFLSVNYSAVINVGALISFWACALAATNGSAHIVFALSRDSFASRRVAILHDRSNAPRRAIYVVFSAGLALLGIGAWLWTAPTTVIGNLSGLGFFGAAACYGLVMIGSLREYAATDLRGRRWHRLALPCAGLAILAYVIYGNIWPIQAPPVRYYPYIALAWFILVMPLSLRTRRRGADAARAAATGQRVESIATLGTSPEGDLG
jgi:amino acid transporter